ncbi:MAG: hypothetical protein ACRDTD_28575, partial [Pseudonocardiaceae bacterium]
PRAAQRQWLSRFTLTRDGQMRELAQIVVDNARDRRSPRLRRESVEISLFTGRSWLIRHQPLTTPT